MLEKPSKPTYKTTASAAQDGLSQDQIAAADVGMALDEVGYDVNRSCRLAGFAEERGNSWEPPAGTIAFFAKHLEDVVIAPKVFCHRAEAVMGVHKMVLMATAQLTPAQIRWIDQLDDLGDVDLQAGRASLFYGRLHSVWLLKYAEDLHPVGAEPRIEEALTFAGDTVAQSVVRAALDAVERGKISGPNDEDRVAACQFPDTGYAYAACVDKRPHDVTRAAAVKDPHYAYKYARYGDKAPRDDTRKAANLDPIQAAYYATAVDHYPHPTLVAKWGEKISKNPADYMKEPTISESMVGRDADFVPNAQDRRDGELAVARGRNNGPKDADRASACLTPVTACAYAESVDCGPHDDTRKAACGSPEQAEWYAEYADRGPRDDTRQAACADPEWAFWYASRVDKCVRDDTREAACASLAFARQYVEELDGYPHPMAVARWGKSIDQSPGYYDLRMAEPTVTESAARILLRRLSAGEPLAEGKVTPAKKSAMQALVRGREHGPNDKDRKIACSSPPSAYFYAYQVDQGPRADTRAAASKDSWAAYEYAKNVDKAPHDVTRAGACLDYEGAVEYARDIDKCPRDDTREAASRGPTSAHRYAAEVDDGPHPATRRAAAQHRNTAEAYATQIDRYPHPDLVKRYPDIARLAPEDFGLREPVVEAAGRPARKALRRPGESAPAAKPRSVAELDAQARALKAAETAAAAFQEGSLHGPSDETRQSALLDAHWAYLYARHVDCGPRDDTRKAACGQIHAARNYAQFVDCYPHPTLVAAWGDQISQDQDFYCMPAEPKVESQAAPVKLSETETREKSLKNAGSAFSYAFHHGGDDELRRAASREPEYALDYARNVDKAPHPVTRSGACRSPSQALWYATEVDHMPTPETRAAVQYDKAWARQYKTLEKSHDAWIFPPGVAESQSATHSKTGRLMDELLETAVDDFVQRLDPEDAVDYAVKHGGSDALRAAASRWAECALFYAQHVDRGPHPVTRKGACRNPENAFWYALEIDRRPTPETRLGVSVDPGWRSRYEEAENYPERWLTHTEPEILESIGELIQRHYVTFDQQPEDGRYLGTPAVWDEACNKWKVMGIEDDVYLHRPARLISAPIEGFVDHDWEQDLDAAEVTVIKDLKPSEWYPDFEDPTAVRLPLLPPPIEEASTRRTPTGRSEAILAWLNAKISAVKVDRATASHTDITSHLWDTDPAYAKVAKVGLEVGFNSQAQGLGRRTADKLLTHAIHWGNLPKSGQVYLSPAEWDAVHDRWFVAETSSDSHLTRDAYLVSCLVGAWERQDNFSADAKDITVLKRLDRVEWYFGGVEDPTSVPLPLEVPKIEEAQKPLFRQPLSPEDALQWARYYGTSKETRDVCLKFPHWAYMYAMYVDHKPSDDTRQAVLPDVTWSERYAKNVDKYPHPVILARHGSDAISTKHADYAPIPQPEAVNDEDRSWVPDVHESALMQKDKVASAAWAGKVKAQMKACWANAVKAVKRGPDNLVYVEGFASLAKFNGIVVEHGWVEDGETIIDPTLPEADAEYFPGVRYTKAQVKELSKDREPPFVWGGDGGFGGYSNKDYKAAHDLAWSKLLPNEPKLLGESISDDCRAAEEAYRQALTEGPSDKTRAAACLIDHHAYMYALYVDKGPRDDTRAAACRDSFIACSYALNVDRMPRDDTRKSASRSKDSAVKYAISVDKYPHPDLVAAQGGLISQHPASYIAEPTVE